MSSAYDFLATSIAKSLLSRMADEGLAHLDLASGIVLHCARGGVYDQAGVNAAFGNRLGPARQALQALRITMQAIQFAGTCKWSSRRSCPMPEVDGTFHMKQATEVTEKGPPSPGQSAKTRMFGQALTQTSG
jgi:hypothetical protein